MTNLYIQPNWTQAPPWAEYWAADSDGRAYWFSHRPKYEYYDVESDDSEGVWVHDKDKHYLGKAIMWDSSWPPEGFELRDTIAWNNTLRARHLTTNVEPDWAKAPGWAKYWAVETHGEAFWFSHKPIFEHDASSDPDVWNRQQYGVGGWSCSEENAMHEHDPSWPPTIDEDWEHIYYPDTLRVRP